MCGLLIAVAFLNEEHGFQGERDLVIGTFSKGVGSISKGVGSIVATPKL